MMPLRGAFLPGSLHWEGEGHTLSSVPQDTKGSLGKGSKKQQLQGFQSRSESEEGTLGRNIHRLPILYLPPLGTLYVSSPLVFPVTL